MSGKDMCPHVALNFADCKLSEAREASGEKSQLKSQFVAAEVIALNSSQLKDCHLRRST